MAMANGPGAQNQDPYAGFGPVEFFFHAASPDRSHFADPFSMAILAVAAVVEKGMHDEPRAEFDRIRRLFTNSTFAKEIRLRMVLARKRRGDPRQFVERYRNGMQRHRRMVAYQPLLAHHELVNALPKRTRDRVTAPITDLDPWLEPMQRFTDRYLNRSLTGLQALLMLTCVVELPLNTRDVLEHAEQNEVLKVLVRGTKAEPKPARERRQVRDGVKMLNRIMALDGYNKRLNGRYLMNRARMWAMVQVHYDGVIAAAARGARFAQEFGQKMSRSHLKDEISLFDNALDVRRGPGQVWDGFEEQAS